MIESVNPARAGMIRMRSRSTRQSCGKPRASGDDPENGLSNLVSGM